jgi:hypothetical protein
VNDDGVTAGALAVSSTARCCVRRSVGTSGTVHARRVSPSRIARIVLYVYVLE